MSSESRNWAFPPSKNIEQVRFSPVRQVMENMNKYIREGKQIITFHIGEPDFYTPGSVIEATKIALDKRLTHYAPNRGSVNLRNSIAKLLSQRGMEYDPATEVLVTAGGAEAIFAGLFAFLNAGDEVIVPTPSFMNYENVLAMIGAKYVELPLTADDDFQINIKELEKKITDKTRMIILNNPSNPTGVIFTEKVLKSVAEIAIKYDLMVFSDEIYDEILYDDTKCVSIGTFEGMRDRAIVMNGFSKSHAMTGWRVGYLAAPAEAITSILKVHQYVVTCIPTFIQEGLAASMLQQECLEEKNQMVATFTKKRNLLMECLKKVPELTYIRPQGAFYMFLDVSKTGLSGTEFATKLLDTKYVAVVPGVGFSSAAEDFVRLSFATSEENIVEGINRIREFVDSVQKKN